jgi:uncharacterized RDD family membrane protein YckC
VASQLAPLQPSHPSYAGFGSRLAAYLVDAGIISFVTVLVAVTWKILHVLRLLHEPAAVATGIAMTPEMAWRVLGPVAKIFAVFAYIVSTGPLYRVLFEASPWQATLGKRLLNIYVTDDQGKRISIGQSFYRWFAGWVFAWFGGSFISALTVAWASNKKTIHDYFANTVVVRGRPVPGGLRALAIRCRVRASVRLDFRNFCGDPLTGVEKCP